MDANTLEFGGILALLLCVMGSRWIHERGYSALDSATKVRFVDAFSKLRVFAYLPVIALVVVMFITTKYFASGGLELIIFFLLLTIAIMAGMSAYVFIKIVRIGLPRRYVHHYLGARALTFLGSVLFLAGSFAQILAKR
ncbi:MAG: hypothetical protein L6Q76_26360 [Polyangiaceae bacterium]|nr:hypothetical protein [Polyangiaceae bacterium]